MLYHATIASVAGFLMESVTNISVLTQFVRCGFFSLPMVVISTDYFFFCCQASARSVFVLLLLLSNCDLFTRSDSCFLSRRAEMQEGQMH